MLYLRLIFLYRQTGVACTCKDVVSVLMAEFGVYGITYVESVAHHKLYIKFKLGWNGPII